MSNKPLVLDNGTGYLKIGFSKDQEPRSVIPTLVGRPMLRYAEKIENVELKEINIGDEVLPIRNFLELKYPIENGMITEEEDMLLLWKYSFTNKLGIPEDEYKNRKILITEAPLTPNKNKVKMAEMILENLNFSGFNIEASSKLSLICEGLETGIVLDSGESITQCIPIGYGYILPHQVNSLYLGGRNITEHLTRLLQLKGYNFNSTADYEYIRELKEKYCFVSCDYKSDEKLDSETTYYNTITNLPDGRRIMLSNERFIAPEILFTPYLVKSEFPGIADMTFNSINSCDINMRKDLYKNIIISGGSTLFPGFTTRFENDIKNIYKEKNLKLAKSKEIKIDIKIIDSPRRKFSVFIGASTYAGILESHDEYWITNEDWKESGEKIIFKKCQNIMTN